MAYKIFLSHAKKDLPVATVIASRINAMFSGDVLIYLFQDQIRGGRSWKAELKKHLDSCDSIFSLVSPSSINNKWIYLEWSPFWLRNKQFFILLADGISTDVLINPMQENQSIFLTKKDSIRYLLSEIASLAGSKSIAIYEMLEDFIIEIEQAFQQQLEEDFEIFRRPDKTLPATDTERAIIAQYFYDRDEIEHFIRITKRINNDEKVLDFIYSMFRDTKMSHSQELSLTLELAKNMNRASNIAAIVHELIDLGNSDAEETFRIVDLIADRSMDVLSDIVCKLITRDMFDSKLYSYIMNEKIKSNAIRRSIAVFMLKKELEQTAQFNNLVVSIKNTAELKNLAIEFVDMLVYQKSEFIFVVDRIVRLGANHLSVVFDELYEKDSNFALQLLSKLKEKHDKPKLREINYG